MHPKRCRSPFLVRLLLGAMAFARIANSDSPDLVCPDGWTGHYDPEAHDPDFLGCVVVSFDLNLRLSLVADVYSQAFHDLS